MPVFALATRTATRERPFSTFIGSNPAILIEELAVATQGQIQSGSPPPADTLNPISPSLPVKSALTRRRCFT
jgi:hypothetical protein